MADCSERAEIWEKTKARVPYNRGVWYGFAVKFADPVPSGDHRYLIAQWKREIGPTAKGDFSPFLALRLNNGKLFATVETNYVAPPKGATDGTAGSCAPPGPPEYACATCGGATAAAPAGAGAQALELAGLRSSRKT